MVGGGGVLGRGWWWGVGWVGWGGGAQKHGPLSYGVGQNKRVHHTVLQDEEWSRAGQQAKLQCIASQSHHSSVCAVNSSLSTLRRLAWTISMNVAAPHTEEDCKKGKREETC